MNIDFHYYAVYFAAYLAGYTQRDAAVIAHASQYVDDSNEDRQKALSIDGYAFYGKPTTQKLIQLGVKNIWWNEASINESMRVWSSFHFLPGHTAPGEYITDPAHTMFRNPIYKWEFDTEAEEQLKCVCAPCSAMCAGLLDDTLLYYRADLYMLGLRMHVFADTWAHSLYSGIPSWFLNGSGEYQNLPTDITRLTSSLMDKLPSFNSMAYLGHSMAGHAPDYPYLTFSVKPFWSREFLQRDNPNDFHKAFLAVFRVLDIANSDIDNANLPAGRDIFSDAGIEAAKQRLNARGILPQEFDSSVLDNLIQSVLQTEKTDQSETWKDALTGMGIPLPPAYDADLWIKKARQTRSDNYGATDFARFAEAAVRHMEWTEQELHRAGIHLYDTPDERIVRTFLVNFTDGTEIKTGDEASNIPSLAPPGTEGSEIGLIFLRAAVLNTIQTDDIIRIKRNTLADGNYLMVHDKNIIANKLDFAVKDTDPTCQKWRVKQLEGEAFAATGVPVDANRPVLFMNAATGEYLCADGQKLTTSKSLEKAQWRLRTN